MPPVDPPQTLADVLHTATALLSRGSESARLDAELLLEHVTGLPRATFRASPERHLPTQAAWSFQQLVKRRLKGEPIAYIRGQQEFWSLLLEVTPATLIPRPETELLVERALAHVEPSAAARIADLGTGSGAVAIAIASERSMARVVASDISKEALEVAIRNTARLQIPNVHLAQGSWFTALQGSLRGPFDVIVTNPPYIALDDPDLAPGVRKHEPTQALISGRTGLEAICHIVGGAPQYLAPGGWLVLEHGWKQAAAVRELLVRGGFRRVGSHADLAGHERVTEGCFG
jgi:release factor glutamine methyltransferase